MGEEAKIYNEESLRMLQQEVEQLEHEALDAIGDFEARLHGLKDVIFVDKEEEWSSRLDTIEIYTMEQIPPLKESIRKVRA